MLDVHTKFTFFPFRQNLCGFLFSMSVKHKFGEVAWLKFDNRKLKNCCWRRKLKGRKFEISQTQRLKYIECNKTPNIWVDSEIIWIAYSSKGQFHGNLNFPPKSQGEDSGNCMWKTANFFFVKENQFSKYQSFNGSFNKFNDLLTCDISFFPHETYLKIEKYITNFELEKLLLTEVIKVR